MMVGLIVIFLASYAIFEEMKTFQYDGLTFTKEKFGDIPVFRYYYYTHPSAITITGSVVQEEPTLINLLFRVDPRENDVVVDGEIELPPKTKFVYVSINDTNFKDCQYTQVAVANLASFLVTNGFEIKGAVPDKAQAKEIEVRYADCSTNQNNAVILIQSATEENPEPKITRQDNCYVVNVAGCDILSATEKFQTQVIIDAKIRAEEGGTAQTVTFDTEE